MSAATPDPAFGRSRTYVLLPGAWMGGWVWQAVADRLEGRGHRALTPTLAGLSPGEPIHDVRLQTHVAEVAALLDAHNLRDVVLVGHSYSGLVAGQVADRRPDRVRHTVFVHAFLPRQGRSLLDDFSDDPAIRAQEGAAIAASGGWAPSAASLRQEPDLSDAQRRWLAERFLPHPGHTITDPAVMSRSVESLSATCLTSGAPFEPRGVGSAWTIRRIAGGHWPMVARPDELAGLLADAAC